MFAWVNIIANRYRRKSASDIGKIHKSCPEEAERAVATIAIYLSSFFDLHATVEDVVACVGAGADGGGFRGKPSSLERPYPV